MYRYVFRKANTSMYIVYRLENRLLHLLHEYNLLIIYYLCNNIGYYVVTTYN